MADDKIAELRLNLMEKGLLGKFNDHVEINRQGHAVPISEIKSETPQEIQHEIQYETQYETQHEKRKKNTYGDYDLRDSCVAS